MDIVISSKPHAGEWKWADGGGEGGVSGGKDIKT